MDTFHIIPKQENQEHLKNKLFSATPTGTQKLKYQSMECMRCALCIAGPYGQGNYLPSSHLSTHWKKDRFGKKDGKILLKEQQFLTIPKKHFCIYYLKRVSNSMIIGHATLCHLIIRNHHRTEPVWGRSVAQRGTGTSEHSGAPQHSGDSLLQRFRRTSEV